MKKSLGSDGFSKYVPIIGEEIGEKNIVIENGQGGGIKGNQAPDQKISNQRIQYISIEGRKTIRIWRSMEEEEIKMEMIEIRNNFYIGIKTIEIYFLEYTLVASNSERKEKKISGKLSQNFECGIQL